MLISHSWLQTYFKDPLPATDELVQVLTRSSFEPEGTTSKEGDDVMDFDVLPNRAHDCLSHRGFAREVHALLDIPMIGTPLIYAEQKNVKEHTLMPSVEVDTDTQCTQYWTRMINNVHVTESPAWLQDRLRAIGQRPINCIVDATNYVLFDLGQPLHAFDADTIVGTLHVRCAKEGETTTTLDGTEVSLLPLDVVIADDKGILGIAGVKGSKRAGVTSETKNIILEAAHFNPIRTRKTSRRIPIITDASKRFENEVSPHVIPDAMDAITALIVTLAHTDEISHGPVRSTGDALPKETSVTFSLNHVASLLGNDVPRTEIISILKRIGCRTEETTDTLTVYPPLWRLDLVIPEDIIEEIGRVYGYERIPSVLIETPSHPVVCMPYWYRTRLRNALIQKGFSEIYTYSFVHKGVVEMQNPIASDKGFLRTNLAELASIALEKNAKNAVLFGASTITIFEIGNVHIDTATEEKHLWIGVDPLQAKARTKGSTTIIHDIIKELEQETGLELHTAIVSESPLWIEVNLTQSFSCSDTQEDSYESLALEPTDTPSDHYHPFSLYPFMTRDIALWVPEEISAEHVQDTIVSSIEKHFIRIDLFDTFKKEGKVSYAFRIVFQSREKTLTDDEVNTSMKEVESSVQKQGWEVR